MLNQLQFPGMPESRPEPAEYYVGDREPMGDPSGIRARKAAEMHQRMQVARPAIAFDTHNMGEVYDYGFRNQHEVGDSNGLFDPLGRRKEEQRLFNIPSGVYEEEDDDENIEYIDEGDPVGPESRPIYGFAWDDDAVANDVSNQYGRAVAELKPEVARRATVTSVDSLDSVVVPTTWHRAQRGDFDPLKTQESYAGGKSYIEAQYHGGLSLDDAQRVSFFPDMIYDRDTRTYKPTHDSEWNADARDILEEADIPWREMTLGNTYRQQRMLNEERVSMVTKTERGGTRYHTGLRYTPELNEPPDFHDAAQVGQDWYASRSWSPDSDLTERKPYPVEPTPIPPGDEEKYRR